MKLPTMRLGAVPYLNTLPLIHFLPEKPRLAPPAVLDRLLKLGEVDLATAPIITLLENPQFRVVPGLAIGCRGPVKSVRLIFKKTGMTLADCRSIYLDMESRTSILLLKVLLHFRFGRNLEQIRFFHPLPSPEADAMLLIGNKALQEYENSPSLDLGLEWCRWTGLPFVFAAWIGRLPECPPDLIESLHAAHLKGMANLDQLLSENQILRKEEAKEYLHQNVSFELGEEEAEGIKRFHSHLKELGLIQHDFRLPYYPR